MEIRNVNDVADGMGRLDQFPHLTQEDIALRDIVEIWHNEGDNDGRAKWPAIADLLKARTGIGRAPKQCRER